MAKEYVINDMSEVNTDVELVRDGGAELSRTDEKLVEMSNGLFAALYVMICFKKFQD